MPLLTACSSYRILRNRIARKHTEGVSKSLWFHQKWKVWETEKNSFCRNLWLLETPSFLFNLTMKAIDEGETSNENFRTFFSFGRNHKNFICGAESVTFSNRLFIFKIKRRSMRALLKFFGFCGWNWSAKFFFSFLFRMTWVALSSIVRRICAKILNFFESLKLRPKFGNYFSKLMASWDTFFISLQFQKRNNWRRNKQRKVWDNSFD